MPARRRCFPSTIALESSMTPPLTGGPEAAKRWECTESSRRKVGVYQVKQERDERSRV